MHSSECAREQFDNAALVEQSGAGHGFGHFKHVTAEALAAALMRVTSDEAIKARAAELGAALRADDGVTRAVTALEQFARDELATGRWEAAYKKVLHARRQRSGGCCAFLCRMYGRKDPFATVLARRTEAARARPSELL